MRHHFRIKTDMQHSAQTHTPDNAPRASMQCVNRREVRDKKKKKERKEMKETFIYSFPHLHPLTLLFNKSTMIFIFIRALNDLYKDIIECLWWTGKNTPCTSLDVFSSLHHLFLILFCKI